jgi:competence protein ComEA
VEACGGFGDNASGNINLVYALNENITLIIKSADDGGGASVVKSPGDAILIDSENGLIDGKININHADASALGLLPGIGEKTAMDIIDYRNANGLFSAIEDIMGVPGIKESKFEKIKDYISIE